MSGDEELVNFIKERGDDNDETPNAKNGGYLGRKREAAKPKAVKVEGDPDEIVWIKCITDLQPWDEEKPLLQWQDYQVKKSLAAVLESRRHAVLLQPPKGK